MSLTPRVFLSVLYIYNLIVVHSCVNFMGIKAQIFLQEKVFELFTSTRTKLEGFQTQISK